MKRSIKLAVAAAVALAGTAAFATNGDELIGLGAKSRGMGGVGIGMSHGSESALSNPALISTVKGTEVSFGGTMFMPKVKTNASPTATGTDYGMTNSAADMSVIPEISIAQKESDLFTWGIGMFGTAGMGVDYRNTGTNYEAVSNLQLMQFAVPLAFTVSDFTIAVAPALQYGSLNIDYDANWMAPGKQSSTQGVAQDFGWGYTVGAAYNLDALTLGAVYKSAIDMVYDGQISKAASDFSGGMLLKSDHLEQPSQYGLGLSYKLGGSTFAFDYKRINWASAKGYKDFKWEDQNVYVLGYEYAQDGWAVRAGYNHAKSPIKEQSLTGGDGFGNLYNTFNLLLFPGIIENHYTLGGSIALSKTLSLDLAYVYAPETTANFASGTGMGQMTTSGRVETKHSQQSGSAQLSIKF